MRSSSVMDFRFGLIVIFLILDVTSVRFTGNGYVSKNSTEVQHGFGYTSFFQTFINNTMSVQDNFFRLLNVGNSVIRNIIPSQVPNTTFHNKDTSYKILHPITHAPSRLKDLLLINVNSQTTLTPVFRKNPIGNIAISPTFMTDSSLDMVTDPSSLPKPITQRPYTQSSYYHLSTSISYIPVFNTSSSVDNDSTASRTPIPPKIDPPNTSLPPLDNLPFTSNTPVTATISERKCEEYEREIVRTIATMTGSSTNVNNTCFSTNHLIVGDNQAQIDEFPHLVALGTVNSLCGGTLISHSWVLSAAHCFDEPNDSPIHARIGIYRLEDHQTGVMIPIKNIVRHPDYTPPALYANIALVQLMNAVTFSKSIRPACLYQKYDTVPTQTWFSGWDITQKGKDPTRVQKVQLDTIDNLFCTVRHNISTKIPYGVTPSMICAGDPRGNWTKDGCQSDFGGPLQTVHPDRECLFQIIGIFSFSKGCGLTSNPGVYTRVSHYLPWIEEIVWPQEQ